MTLAIISFLDESGPLSDAGLQQAFDSTRAIVPPGSRVEARAFDRTWLELSYTSPDGEPKFTLDDPDALPKPLSGAITVWIDDSLDNVELQTQQTAKALHQAIGARTTGIFDGQCHLDLTKDGKLASVQGLAIVTRRPDMDRDEFMQYYRTTHVPLAKRNSAPFHVRYTTFRLLERFGDFPGDACMLSENNASLEVMKKTLLELLHGEDEEDARKFVYYLVEYVGQRSLACNT